MWRGAPAVNSATIPRVTADGIEGVLMLPTPRTPADDVVRVALLSTSTRLQVLWEEAALERRASPAVSLERQRWDSAAQRLVDAMEAVERLAETMEPSLGRRDWRSRCNKGDGRPWRQARSHQP
jgi:hypothetical protein